MTDGSLDDSHRDLDPSLEPHFASLLSRHREAVAKTEWSYQQFLPPEIEKRSLSPTAYMAVETALLTEVNLPWYTAGLVPGLASCPGPIQEFVRVWASEEDQHATLLESYLLLTGGGDHAARARSRKAMIAGGWSHTLAGPFEGMVYTAMQEAATRTFYLCAARACGEESPPLAAVMLRFEMPWAASVLRDFEERRALLSARGVFRLSDYLDEVVQPLWAYWGLEGRTLEREETRRAFVQLRRYRAALRKFARSETRPVGDSMSSKDPRLLVAT